MGGLEDRILTRHRGSYVQFVIDMGRLSCLLALLLTASATAQPLALVDVTVIDVENGATEPEMTVVVKDNLIATVGRLDNVHVPDDATVVDASGKYLIPGLWDMHTHLLWSTDASEHYWVDMPEGVDSWTLWERYYAPALTLTVANGITGIREMWGNLDVAERVRRETASGERWAPRMIVAGDQIDGPPASWSSVPLTTEEAGEVVDSLAAAGADFIKVYNFVRPDVYRAITHRANEIGIPFAGHVPWLVTATEASESGQRSFEHMVGVDIGCSNASDSLIKLNGQLMEAIGEGEDADADSLNARWFDTVLATQDDARCRALLQLLAENETWLVPTLIENRGIAYQNDPAMREDERMKYIHPSWRASWLPENDPYQSTDDEGYANRRRIYERRVEITGMAVDEGVPILAGSDTPNAFAFPGFGLHDELQLLVEVGLTRLEALQSATINPARYLEATDSLGTVEEGKLADLVLLEANPLEDISNTQLIRAVVADGRLYRRADLDRLFDEVEASVERIDKQE